MKFYMINVKNGTTYNFKIKLKQAFIVSLIPFLLLLLLSILFFFILYYYYFKREREREKERKSARASMCV
jgi:preprotein translocase subunit YajC